MSISRSARATQAAAAALLAVISAVPYTIEYAVDRTFGAPNAATAALWPTAVAPVLVAALFAVQVLRERASRPAKVAVAQPPAPWRTRHSTV
jgi:hypothetical protein